MMNRIGDNVYAKNLYNDYCAKLQRLGKMAYRIELQDDYECLKAELSVIYDKLLEYAGQTRHQVNAY